jgi:hypothetical protein
MSKVMKAVTGIFAPKIPKPAPTPAMPDPESVPNILAARKKIEEGRKAGRAGTIYTSSSGAYDKSNLGGTA